MHGNSKEEAQNEVSYLVVSCVLIPSQFYLLLLLKDISFGWSGQQYTKGMVQERGEIITHYSSR